MNRSVSAQMMVIVQHQDELLLDSLQDFVQKNIRSAFRVLRDFTGSFLKVGEERFTKAGYSLLDAKSEIPQEHRGVSIGMIQLVPNKLSLVGSEEIGHQGGFSRPGVGGNQSEWIGQVR